MPRISTELSDDAIKAGIAAYDEWERVTGRDDDPKWITPGCIDELVKLIVQDVDQSRARIRVIEPNR
jgi:hypothetical protein